MPTPGWFRETFEAYVLDMMQRNRRGEKMDPYEGADILWDLIVGQSERAVAKALEDLFSAKELPVMMPGGIVNKVHVDRIAKHLVHRGGVVGDDEPFEGGVDGSIGAEGTEVPHYQSERDRWRPTYDGAGRRPGWRNRSDEEFRRQREGVWETEAFISDHVQPDEFARNYQSSKLEDIARAATQRGHHVGFVDENGKVQPT